MSRQLRPDPEGMAADLAGALLPRPALASPSDDGALARSSPAGLGVVSSRGHWRLAPHLELIDELLCRVATGKTRRAMIFAPPRHGKSSLVSHYFCSWYLGRYPDRRVMLASYEAEFASSWGRKVRDTLGHWGRELFGVHVRADVAAASRFEIEGHLGSMVCAGAGGPITGRGADLLVLDDPIKNNEDAMSELQREKMWDWYRSTAYPRLEPDGVIVLIMTRWHEDDLAGRLLQAASDGGQPWEVLRLPALAEEADALGRQPGEALWPQRFSAARLLENKREMGSLWFAAEYQGRPQPASGSVFRRGWFRYYRAIEDGFDLGSKVVPDKECTRFTTVDLAVSLKTSADYTVVATWAQTRAGDLILLDLVRRRLEGPDQVKLLRSVYERYKPSFLAIENVAYQLALIQQARRDGLPVKELKPDRDKLSRAQVAAAQMEGGSIYFPASAVFLEDLETELLAFPRGRHDDQVDVVSYAALVKAGAKRTLVPMPVGIPKRSSFIW
jgi:predicted phage terminase large subunit-like protein